MTKDKDKSKFRIETPVLGLPGANDERIELDAALKAAEEALAPSIADGMVKPDAEAQIAKLNEDVEWQAATTKALLAYQDKAAPRIATLVNVLLLWCQKFSNQDLRDARAKPRDGTPLSETAHQILDENGQVRRTVD